MASTDIDAPWMNEMRNVDKNHDGSISHQELKEYLMKEAKSSNYAKNANMQPDDSNDLVSKLFSGKDKNGDGSISFEEFQSRHEDL